MNLADSFSWHGPAVEFALGDGRLEMQTLPRTDLWQRTYYQFRNDNAPMFLCSTKERYFSFSVRTDFNSSHRFDQCGIAVYLDSDNWLKASAEYQDAQMQQLGSVVTNNGYSDWATAEIKGSIRTIWYRLSRRESDFRIESSYDGRQYAQMRVCHMWGAEDGIRFGVYACSPEDSSFHAVFSEFELGECKWLAHDGQPPDPDWARE